MLKDRKKKKNRMNKKQEGSERRVQLRVLARGLILATILA